MPNPRVLNGAFVIIAAPLTHDAARLPEWHRLISETAKESRRTGWAFSAPTRHL